MIVTMIRSKMHTVIVEGLLSQKEKATLGGWAEEGGRHKWQE